MKITFIATHCDAPDEDGWQEYHESDAAGTPEEIIHRLLDNFNATLRRGELPRRLVKIVGVEKSPQKHIWGKASLVTEQGGYDRMRCRACGATGKRYGLGQDGVKLDKEQPKSCPGYDL